MVEWTQGRKNRTNKQKRPYSRTLSSVHDSTLEDLVYPTEIVGRRTRVRVDGSKLQKVPALFSFFFSLTSSSLPLYPFLSLRNHRTHTQKPLRWARGEEHVVRVKGGQRIWSVVLWCQEVVVILVGMGY